jgi:hypothetical protein
LSRLMLEERDFSMQLFDVTEEKQRLILAKRRLPFIIDTLLLGGFFLLLAATAAAQNLIPNNGGQNLGHWFMCIASLSAVYVIVALNYVKITKSEIWIFDVEHHLLSCNNGFKVMLKDIKSLTASRSEDADGIMCSLMLELWQRPPVRLDSRAKKTKQWEEYLSIGTQVSVLTGIRFIVDDTTACAEMTSFQLP